MMTTNMVAFNIDKPAAQNSLALRRAWQGIEPNSCPYNYNFHMHTVFSDGQLSPLALMKQAITLGLKGMAITDHHSIEGYRAAEEWLRSKGASLSDRQLPHLWTGVEISCDLLGSEVHILGYAFAPEDPGLKPYLQGKAPSGKHYQAKNAIAAIHQAGGLAILAHPERYRKPANVLIPAAVQLELDGVEAYYAYGNPKPWQPSPAQTKRVLQQAKNYDLFTTCGTDTHGLNILQRI